MLPDGCGLDILRQVRADHLKSKTIIITGCCADLLIEAQQAGAEHCFTKPLDVQRLINAISA
jgi:DNA-binding response OmpR family regulator